MAVRASGERRAGRRSTHGLLSLALGRDNVDRRLARNAVNEVTPVLEAVLEHARGRSVLWVTHRPAELALFPEVRQLRGGMT